MHTSQCLHFSFFLLLSCLLLMFCPNAAWSQRQKDEGYRDLVSPEFRSDKVTPPKHLQNYLVEGKLRLSLRDAIVLTLENNSMVRAQETQVESSKFAVLGAHSPFDPILTSSYNVNSTTSSPVSALQGTGGLNFNVQSTIQFAQLNYSQTFETGTNVQASINSNNSYTNNSFYFFNPFITSALTFQITQPLLRNAWLFANQAPLIIARRSLEQSKASFVAEVNNNILQAATDYWAVVQAHGNLEVAQRSLDAAQKSYARDKRALELGALPPLDIYRSDSEVAARRVQVIQGEYALKQAEDALRMMIGADQDPYFEALDLELTEAPEPSGEPLSVDIATALQQALAKRPEFAATKSALAADQTRVRLAHNHLLPQLDLMGLYTSNGVGGTQFTGTGLKETNSSISQLFGFGFPTYEAQLSLSLPIRNRAAKAELGLALVSRRNDLYTQLQWKEQVTLDVRNAVHQLEEAKLSIAAGKEAVDLAQKNTAAEQRKYELGQGTIFLVLEAQTELATAEQQLLQSQVGYQLAVAGLDHATGQSLEPYQIQIAELTH